MTERSEKQRRQIESLLGILREPLKCQPLVVRNLLQRWRERQTRNLPITEQYRRVWRSSE